MTGGVPVVCDVYPCVGGCCLLTKVHLGVEEHWHDKWSV
jgi:hypothetical protein